MKINKIINDGFKLYIEEDGNRFYTGLKDLEYDKEDADMLFYIQEQTRDHMRIRELILVLQEDDFGAFSYDGVNFSRKSQIRENDIEVGFQDTKINEKYDAVLSIEGFFYKKSFYCQLYDLDFMRTGKKTSKRKKIDIIPIVCATRNDYIRSYGAIKKVRTQSGTGYIKTYRVLRTSLSRAYTDRYSYKGQFRKMIEKKSLPETNKVFICYDIETNTNEKGELYPYLIYAEKFNLYDDIDCEKENECFSVYDNDSEKLIERFCHWIHRKAMDLYYNNLDPNDGVGHRHHLIIFGFNNFRFDDQFIIPVFRKNKEYSAKFSSRFGKTTSEVFYYKSSMKVEFSDLVKFCPDKSLKEAGKEYGVEQQKMDFKILEYNEWCKKWPDHTSAFREDAKLMMEDEEILNKYETESDEINVKQLCIDYCKMDVQSTIELCNKIIENSSSLINEICPNSKRMIFDFPSIPSLSYFIFENILIKQEKKRIHFPSDYNKFYRQAYFGGRVCGSCYGEYTAKNKIAYMDVTSGN